MPAQGEQSNYERTKELTDRLENGMKELFQSDKYIDFLKSMSQFHNYSRRNIMLIRMQMPGASQVASYTLWKEKFNRYVKKGEKGIRIFAPIKTKPEKKLMEKLDPLTGAPLRDKDGKIIMEEMTKLEGDLKFKLVSVFDVSQTAGEPLPELVENLTGNVEHYSAFMDALKEVSPLPIEFEPMPEGQDGYCQFGKKIGIREGMSEVQTISAVVHEITHARIHDKEKVAEDAPPKSKEVKEIEAESVSYVTCQHYNIETSPNSFGYLAGWGSRDLSELMASLDMIRKESNSLINDIDDRFSDICKERSIDLSPAKPDKVAETVAKQEPSFSSEILTKTASGTDCKISEIKQQTPIHTYESAKSVPELKSKEENIPDSAISITEMHRYGYQYENILPLTQEKALELYDKDYPIYLLYPDDTEALVSDRSEIEAFDGIFGIEREDWERKQEYTALSAKNSEAAKESEIINGSSDMFGIYQLKDVEDTRYHRFTPLNQLEAENLAVDRSNYELVYSAPLSAQETLINLYHQFNTERPKDFTGHSMSVSDVVVMQRDGEVTSHYVDNFGFTKLPAFLENEKEPESAIENLAENQKSNQNVRVDKIENTDLRRALGFIADNNTLLYGETDLEISLDQIERTAKLNDDRDKTLIWISHPTGIDCYPELEVFQKDTRGYNGVLFHGKDMPNDRKLAYSVNVQEVKNGKIIGSLTEIDIRKYAETIEANAIPTNTIRIYKENGKQTTMPKNEFDSRYPQDLGDMTYWRNEPDDFDSLKPIAKAVMENVHSEQHWSCDIWQHSSRLDLDRNKFYSKQILLDLDKLHEPNSEDKNFFTTPLNTLVATALSPAQLSQMLDSLPYENAEFSIKRGQDNMLVKVPRDEVLLDRSRQKDNPIVIRQSHEEFLAELLNEKQKPTEKQSPTENQKPTEKPSILKALKQDAKKTSIKDNPKKEKKKSKETEI